jgi:predicted double-glycine peptidase
MRLRAVPVVPCRTCAAVAVPANASGRRLAGWLLAPILALATAATASTAAASTAPDANMPVLPAQSIPPVPMANVVTGLNGLQVRVHSLLDLRFKDLVRQQRDFSCGAAAVATILQQLYGKPVSEEIAIIAMLQQADRNTVVQQGFSLKDMKNLVERIGLRGHGYRIPALSLRAIKIPVIAVQNTGGYSHFIVLKRVENGIAYIGDPALGNRQLPVEEFVAGWNGIVFAIVGDRLQQDSGLWQSAQSLAAPQRAAIITRMLPQQREFGLLGIGNF